MSTTLRFGLIACGLQGRYMADALVQIPGTALIACCDTNDAALASVPGEQVERYSSYHAMLDGASLDAVIVATSHSALAGATMAAIEKGRHVFCEKPLALTAAEARPVVEAAERAGVNLQIGYCLRFDSLRKRMKELLDRGVAGKIAFISAGKGGPPHTGWLAERETGGGQLLWVGSHMVDQVLWLLDRRAERVFAEIEWQTDTGSDNTSVFTVRFEDGILAHFDCSQAGHAAYDFIEVVGRAGRIRTDWMPRRLMRVHSDVMSEYRDPTTSYAVSDDKSAMYPPSSPSLLDRSGNGDRRL